MKADVYAKWQQRMRLEVDALSCYLSVEESVGSAEMGLSPGGLMTQEIYHDHYGIDSWDTSTMSRCFIHIVNSRSFQSITGFRPPNEPPTAEQYEKARIPWFDYWNDEAKALEGSKMLAKLDSVTAIKIKHGKMVTKPVVDIRKGASVRPGDRGPLAGDK